MAYRRFTLHSILKRLQSTVNTGSAGLNWVKQQRYNTGKTVVKFDDANDEGLGGELPRSFDIDKDNVRSAR